MKNKITFKTEKPVGRWKAFESIFHYIKLNKKGIGTIDHNEPHAIRLMVIKDDIMEDKNPNCTWKWIQLNKQSKSLEEAKTWVETHFEAIAAKYKIRNEE
jgi:hypothetical protein